MMEISVKDIETLLDKKVKPINEAITKLTASTVILEKSIIKMEETQRHVTELLVAREKVSSDVEHLSKAVDKNMQDIDNLYTILREGANTGKQRMFSVIMAIVSGGMGAVFAIIAFKFR